MRPFFYFAYLVVWLIFLYFPVVQPLTMANRHLMFLPRDRHFQATRFFYRAQFRGVVSKSAMAFSMAPELCAKSRVIT